MHIYSERNTYLLKLCGHLQQRLRVFYPLEHVCNVLF